MGDVGVELVARVVELARAYYAVDLSSEESIDAFDSMRIGLFEWASEVGLTEGQVYEVIDSTERGEENLSA